MRADNVTAAFELIGDEIERVAEEIASSGSAAFTEKNYDEAKQLAESGTRLSGFTEKLETLLSEWQQCFDLELRERVELPTVVNRDAIKRSKRSRLHVKFSDGTTIEHYMATDTFVDALRKLGLSRVAALKIQVRGEDLVGRSESETYSQRSVGGYYITTHSSTNEKFEMLKRVAESLGESLDCRVIPPEG